MSCKRTVFWLATMSIVFLAGVAFAEPFGLSAAESMFCGTPVIAFNKGAMPELIVDGKTGFLVNNIDEAAAVVADIKKIDRRSCRKWSESNFSREKMVEGYLHVYKKILGTS